MTLLFVSLRSCWSYRVSEPGSLLFLLILLLRTPLSFFYVVIGSSVTCIAFLFAAYNGGERKVLGKEWQGKDTEYPDCMQSVEGCRLFSAAIGSVRLVLAGPFAAVALQSKKALCGCQFSCPLTRKRCWKDVSRSRRNNPHTVRVKTNKSLVMPSSRGRVYACMYNNVISILLILE